MSESMLERLCRAACAAEGVPPDAHAYVGMKSMRCWEARIPVVRAVLKEMREPTHRMWDQAENASMGADLALSHAENRRRQKKKFDKAIIADAFNFPTARIWHGVVMYRAMIDAALEDG